MSEEQLAAPEEDLSQIEENQTTTEDPAPSPEDTPEKPDPVQAKINKLVGQKHEERRAREAAEQRAQEAESKLQAQAPAKSDGAPNLEDFDYDDAKFQDALIDYKVDQKTKEIEQRQEQAARQTQQQEAQTAFNAKIAKLNIPDYRETVALIPPLHSDTLEALMIAGPEVANYLGKHLDIADEVSRIRPTAAALRFGQISAQLSNANPTKEPSAAPDPIEPINSGGTASAERGPSGARYE